MNGSLTLGGLIAFQVLMARLCGANQSAGLMPCPPIPINVSRPCVFCVRIVAVRSDAGTTPDV